MANKKQLKVAPKLRGAVAPPAGADYFAIYAVQSARVKNEEGRAYTQTKAKRLHGEALDDGTKPETWPASDFSTRFVLETWGPGLYRVDWFAKDGTRLGGDRLNLDTPPKEAQARAARAHRPFQGEEPEESPAAAYFGGSMPQDPFQWMIWSQQREEAAAERRRQEAREEELRREREYDRRQEQDRQFMQTMMTTLAGRSGGSDQVSGDLLRREMSVAIREGMQSVNERVASALGTIAAQVPQGGDGDRPTDIGDGAERIGLAFLEELEDAAPEIVSAALPNIISLLEGKGWRPSPELQAKIRAMREAAANGAS